MKEMMKNKQFFNILFGGIQNKTGDKGLRV